MKTLKKAFSAILISASLALALPVKQAAAHPHEWVQMRVEVMFNDKAEATGLRYIWLFDEFFTAYALSDTDNVKQADLDALLAEITSNVQEVGYLTKLKIAGDEVDTVEFLGAAKPNAASIKDIRLELDFTVPFIEPVKVQEKPLRYAIFDPTFYVAMHHFDDDNAVTLSGNSTGCSALVNAADPDPDMSEFAASLDQSQDGGDGLGIHFAEWVDIQCAQT